MVQSSFIPGNPRLNTETLYKKQEDYTFVNDCRAKTFRQNPQFVRERDGPFIQSYYQHYEADIPYKNAIFTPQVIPSTLAHRQCNPLVAYPYGMPQNVEHEKCIKCKKNKTCNKKKRTHTKSMKNVSEHEVENLFSSKLKTETTDTYELPENANDDLKQMQHINVPNNPCKDDIYTSISNCSNGLLGSNNFKEVCDCDIGTSEKHKSIDMNSNHLSSCPRAKENNLSVDNRDGNKLYRDVKKYFSHELENCLHLSVENKAYASSMQHLHMDTKDMHKNVIIHMQEDEDFKKDAIQDNEQYCLKVNNEEVRRHVSSLRIIGNDISTENVKYDQYKDDAILKQLRNVSNGNIEGSQNKSENEDEMRSSNLRKSSERQTYDDANAPEKVNSKKDIMKKNYSGVRDSSKNTKQVYICDDIETVSYHVESKHSTSEDLKKKLSKKKKNKTDESSTTANKTKEEDEKLNKTNKIVSSHSERTKRATQPRVCHVEVMLAKKEKQGVKSKQKANDQNSFRPSVTNVDEYFPDVQRKVYDKNRIFHLPAKINKAKNKLEEQINEISSNNVEDTPTTEGITELINNGITSSPSKSVNTPVSKNIGLTKTSHGNEKSMNKLNSGLLIKHKSTIGASSKKRVNKKIANKVNEDTAEKVVSNKSNSEDKKKKLKGKRLLSRSTTVFYGNEKPVPFKTTEVKRFSENVPTDLNKLDSFKLSGNDSYSENDNDNNDNKDNGDKEDNNTKSNNNNKESSNSIKLKRKKTKDATKSKKDLTTQSSNVTKQLKNDIITKKLKSKKKELYDNILSLTKNIKTNEATGVNNKKKGEIRQSSEMSPEKEENIFGKNIDNNENSGKFNLKKSKSMKEKTSIPKRKKDNANADKSISASSLKSKLKTAKSIKENFKDVKKEETKKKIKAQQSFRKGL